VFKIAAVTGPRQAGKTTFIHNYIKKNWKYYSFDNRDLLLRVKSDPELFIKEFNSNIAIDEAQKAPDIFHSIKYLVDSGFKYKIILSGSASFLLMKSISESLAGRIVNFDLLPFSINEIVRKNKKHNLINTIINCKTADELFKKLNKKSIISIKNDVLLDFILTGGFPKLWELKKNQQKQLWLQNYITTYIEKDLRDLAQVGDIDIFQKVYKLIAFQSSNIINMSSIANTVGISVQTVKRYISILQTSYQCALLNSYSINQKKQINKAPKIYLLDTGLMNYFLQNNNTEKMVNVREWGWILETFIFSELYKNIIYNIPKIDLYYWRTNNGAEVDFIIRNNNKLIPIEVKAGINIKKQSLLGMKSFINSQPENTVLFGIVFYRGTDIYFIENNILAVPINLL
jgi:hypothetical protein